jgi:glycosyltransferase involved in cell wall biosynthesis
MTKPSVLYLVTEPWYFANHRLDHARALLADGFDVHVGTRRGDRWDELVEAGCQVHEVEMGRGGGTFRAWFDEIRTVRRLVRSIRPDVVHGVALKPLALTLSLLPMRRRPALILSVNGLGISAAERGLGMRVIRTVIRSARRLPRVYLLFQTRADQTAIVGDRDDGVVIPGVGVDTDRFVPLDRTDPPPCVVAYLGRAVKSKGLLDLAAACEAGDLDDVELHLYCAIDESSPGALSADELERLRRPSQLTLHEPTRDAAGVLGRAHAAILPSRAGEGVSKFVLESLSCGTPVLLSAESGSGEVIDAGRTGVVFTAGDADSIRAALADVGVWTPERRAEVGAACRATALEQFGLDVILPRIVELHRMAAGVEARS